MEFKFKPIVKWPRVPEKNRVRSQFSAKYGDTLDLLESELRHLRARNPVLIQTYMREGDIRIDGLPRADARTPDNPGVIITFEKWFASGKFNEKGQALGNVKPVSVPCDHFLDWKDNLRAIALSLEALRRVDRYGVTQMGEQYTGWTPLPASGGLQSDEEAARTLITKAGFAVGEKNLSDVLKESDFAKSMYRAACRLTHPDGNDGNVEGFNQVQIAWERIKMRHGL